MHGFFIGSVKRFGGANAKFSGFHRHWWRWGKVSRELLLEWCRDNGIVWENPVRENTTHYTVEYTCKAVLVVSYHAVGCERTCYSRV